MNRAKIVMGVALAACTIGVAAPADAATTSQRLKKLESQMKANAKTDAAQAKTIASLRADLTQTRSALGSTIDLLLGCFGSTSMDLDAATSFFTGTPFITVSLNSSAAGPFYLATVNPACVGAITPPITPAAARSARPMFPNAHLPLPALPAGR